MACPRLDSNQRPALRPTGCSISRLVADETFYPDKRGEAAYTAHLEGRPVRLALDRLEALLGDAAGAAAAEAKP